MNCFKCGATVDNGLALCAACQYAAKLYLEFIPIYFRNLSRWRPGKAGSRQVPSSREPQGASPRGVDKVSRAVDEAGAELTTWARCLADDRPHLAPVIDRILSFDEERTVRLLCALFDRRIVSVATVGWAGDFVLSMSNIEQTLRGHTERVVPGWYAGACRQCGYGTYVVPGLTWVTCATCGVTTYARDHLETILNEARPWVAPPRRIAEAVVALLDTELSVPRLHDRIRQWSTRERIDAIRAVDADGDECGPKRYRLGEVLDLVAAEGSTRLDALRVKSAS